MKGYRLQVLGYSFLFVLLFTVTYPLSTAHATVDPLAVPNNKFGIHIITASPDESSPAAKLVNTNGDWGYITVLIESKDRNENKWQEFFNDLRRRHLIPIVRLATKPVNEHWERPYEKEYEAWADFLDRLNWPTKNRYVTIYNEPNHGKEWGNFADPVSYARVLNNTIDALKQKSPDFFVMNAGFDASAPHLPPQYFDEVLFLKEMDKTVPGIFNKLDGWVSHSYPNPGFVGSLNASGRGTVRGFAWELQQLRSLGVTKNLPVFITETGWVHAEGINYNSRYPGADVVAQYYKQAFENTWADSQIVAITPFLLNYQEPPFDHFSFKKITGEGQNTRILGAAYPDYYPQYQTIMDMAKTTGRPVQENKAELTKGEVYSSIVAGESYNISLTFKNTGQSIWNEQVTLKAISGGKELGIEDVSVNEQVLSFGNKSVEPGQEYTFNINLKAPDKGAFKVKLNLFEREKEFDSKPVEFKTEVKLPVILQILSKLKWKDNSAGEYILKVSGVVGESSQAVTLNSSGKSPEIEARYLLPNYGFDFTLEKPYYHPKTIHKEVKSGVNNLDFGALQPALLPALLHPRELWQLLPWSK